MVGESTPRRIVTDLSQRDSRVGFVRKVYGILGVQLFITLGTILAFSANKRAILPVVRGPQGSLLLTGSSLGAFIVMIMFQMRPSLQIQAPMNFLLLGLFTAFESIVVATITLLYRSQSVMLAVAQTAAVVTGLSMYAMQPNPKYDLSALGSLCFNGLLVLSVSVLLALVFKFPVNDVVLSALGALVFSGYIVYDTRRICEGEHPGQSLRSNQYIMGALTLYMDIINLFIYLLRLFGERDQG